MKKKTNADVQYKSDNNKTHAQHAADAVVLSTPSTVDDDSNSGDSDDTTQSDTEPVNMIGIIGLGAVVVLILGYVGYSYTQTTIALPVQGSRTNPADWSYTYESCAQMHNTAQIQPYHNPTSAHINTAQSSCHCTGFRDDTYWHPLSRPPCQCAHRTAYEMFAHEYECP